MHSVLRVGITAELMSAEDAAALAAAETDPATLRVCLEAFAVLTGGTRVETQTGTHHAALTPRAQGWSLELIEAAVRQHAASLLSDGGSNDLFVRLARALGEAGVDADPQRLAAVPVDVELGTRLWQHFSAVADTRPELAQVAELGVSQPLDDATTQELEQLLMYAEHCGQAADNSDREDIRSSTLAYIGGALTTMLHLGHIDERQHSEWHERLTAALGEPPGGWKFVDW